MRLNAYFSSTIPIGEVVIFNKFIRKVNRIGNIKEVGEGITALICTIKTLITC